MRGKCRNKCPDSKKGKKCGCPTVKSYYVEFPVLDDGRTLLLARGVAGAKLKRWKVSSTNRTIAKQQEALIKTDLMKGTIKSEHVQGPMSFDALTERYLAAPEIKKQAVYAWKKQGIKGKLLPVFGGKLVTTITPGMIEEYRATRKMGKGLLGTTIKIATINRDLALLKHLFNFAIRDGCLEVKPRQFGEVREGE